MPTECASCAGCLCRTDGYGSASADVGAAVSAYPRTDQPRRLSIETRAALSACEAQHPRQLEPLVVSVIEGVMASAAIPVAFPPVKLGNENDVDGGARDIVPIEAAVQAGATHVYVVSALAAGVPSPRSMLDGHLIPNFDQTNILDITNRVADEIMTSEIAGFKMDPPNG